MIDLASMVLAPTAVKDGKVYNAIPNDQDLTFSRGTEATRINSAGLIEKARTNLLLQSNTFDTTWTVYNANTPTSGQTGYDGSSDAWLFESTANGGQLIQSVTYSGVNTLSIYAKQGSVEQIQIRFATASPQTAIFDLSTGSFVSSSGTIIDKTIESIIDGWYRVSLSVNATTGTQVNIYPFSGGSTTSGSIYIQSAQLEQGLISTDVITTTTSSVTVGITDDLPRVDYSGGGCPSLLLEPSRTNFYLHSEYISNFSGTETFNSAISPEGVANAVLLTKTSDSDQYVNISWSGATLSTSTDYTLTAFVKHAGDDVNLRYEYNNSNDWGKAWNALFEVRSSGVTASTANGCTSDVEDYGNDWYRIIVNVTTGSSITPSSPSNLIRVIGDNTEEVLIYGVQFEAGSYPSSYLPSYGTSTSRSADGAEVTNASGIIGQTQGVIFLEFVYVPFAFDMRVGISDGTSANYNNLRITSGGTLYVLGANSSVLQYEINAGALTGGETYKVALKYNTNDIEVFVNGISKGTDTSASPAACSRFGFDNRAIGQNPLFSNIKQTILFPTALTDTQLQELTK